MKRFKRFQRTLEDLPNEKNTLRGFLSSRRAKYGSTAVIFTAVVLLFALLFNVLLTGISENLPLTLDFSSSDLFTLSDVSRTLISDALPEERPNIRIRFMMPEDQLKENEYFNMVLECAKTYADAFDTVKVEFLDILTRPADVEEYKDLPVDSTSVVVDCPSKGRAKMIGFESCFLTREGASTYYGFDGETQFTAAIMAVCREQAPVVTFTTGHGEAKLTQLESMFTTAGYEVKHANLARGEFDSATQILVIAAPTTDFIGLAGVDEGKKSEIDILKDYYHSFSDVMVFLSPDTPPLEELDALLAEWGVEIERGAMVLDDAQSLSNSGGKTLIASYGGASYLADGSYSTYGSALHKTLSAKENPPMTLLEGAAPIRVLVENTDGQMGDVSVDSVLLSGENAYVLDAQGERVNGTYTLMALSTTAGYSGEEEAFSHVLVCSTPKFTEKAAAGDAAFGNSEIIYTAMTLMGKEAAPAGIELKKFDDTTLTASETYAKTVLVLSMTVLPGAVLILGTVVYLRRRHK